MWVQIAIWVITTVIGMLLAPKPPKAGFRHAGKPRCASGGIRETHPGVVRHRVIRQANVVWYGDVKTTEIRQSSGSGGKK